jgi:hypothetical protein
VNSPYRREAARTTGSALAGTRDQHVERTAPARQLQYRNEFPTIDVGHIPEPTSNAEYLGGDSDFCPTE